MEIICNICDEVTISSSIIDKHAASRNYVSRKKVVEFFHEINAQIKPSYQNDMSVVVLVVVRAWIKKPLYNYDFLSIGQT